MNKQNEINRLLAENNLRLGGRTVTDFGQVFLRAILETRIDDAQLPGYVKFAKLQEETGELAEAYLQQDGYVKADKPGVGTPIEEAADSILMLIDIVADAYPNVPADKLVKHLEFQLMTKLLKWEKRMVLDPTRETIDFPNGLTKE